MKQKLRSKGKAIINEVLERENVRMIGAPGDSSLCIHAAAAGRLSQDINTFLN